MIEKVNTEQTRQYMSEIMAKEKRNMDSTEKISGKGGELFREQYLYQHPSVAKMETDFKFDENDKTILRQLAEKTASIAKTQAMRDKKRIWKENHDLKSTTPPVDRKSVV